jgi:hypothetical protein
MDKITVRSIRSGIDLNSQTQNDAPVTIIRTVEEGIDLLRKSAPVEPSKVAQSISALKERIQHEKTRSK